MLAIFLIPTALCFAFGDELTIAAGRTLLWAMSLIFVICVALVMWAEWYGNSHFMQLGANSNINPKAKRAASAFLPAVSMRWSPRRPPAGR